MTAMRQVRTGWARPKAAAAHAAPARGVGGGGCFLRPRGVGNRSAQGRRRFSLIGKLAFIRTQGARITVARMAAQRVHLHPPP